MFQANNKLQIATNIKPINNNKMDVDCLYRRRWLGWLWWRSLEARRTKKDRNKPQLGRVPTRRTWCTDDDDTYLWLFVAVLWVELEDNGGRIECALAFAIIVALRWLRMRCNGCDWPLLLLMDECDCCIGKSVLLIPLPLLVRASASYVVEDADDTDGGAGGSWCDRRRGMACRVK